MYLESDLKFLEAKAVFSLTLVVFLPLLKCRTHRRGYILIDLMLTWGSNSDLAMGRAGELVLGMALPLTSYHCGDIIVTIY